MNMFMWNIQGHAEYSTDMRELFKGYGWYITQACVEYSTDMSFIFIRLCVEYSTERQTDRQSDSLKLAPKRSSGRSLKIA